MYVMILVGHDVRLLRILTTRFRKYSILDVNLNCSTEINTCILPAYSLSYHFSWLFGRIFLVLVH